MSIKENDVNLINSPIYNMSMCSLENFYTCFLSWLGKNYKKEFLEILTDKNYDNNVDIIFETDRVGRYEIRREIQGRHGKRTPQTPSLKNPCV